MASATFFVPASGVFFQDCIVIGYDHRWSSLLLQFNMLFFCILVIVKASSGPRYVVGCRNKVDKDKLTAGTRVVLDMTTLTIMRALPREVCRYLQHQCSINWTIQSSTNTQVQVVMAVCYWFGFLLIH